MRGIGLPLDGTCRAWAGLLDNVRKLMSEQVASAAALRIVLAGIEINVAFVRKCARSQLAAEPHRLVISMDTNAVEIITEVDFHLLSIFAEQGFAGTRLASNRYQRRIRFAC